MTENEAIEMFEERLELDVIEDVTEYAEALRTAISALEEIQNYREIGTVEECRNAIEKQKPKRPRDIEYDYSYFICPNCGEGIYATDDFENHKYCLNCGQAIQWDENLEGMEDEQD